VTRLAQFTAIAIFAALLHFTDRAIAGAVQCAAAQSCPNESRK
jgi:hypothetical protein